MTVLDGLIETPASRLDPAGNKVLSIVEVAIAKRVGLFDTVWRICQWWPSMSYGIDRAPAAEFGSKGTRIVKATYLRAICPFVFDCPTNFVA